VEDSTLGLGLAEGYRPSFHAANYRLLGSERLCRRFSGWGGKKLEMEARCYHVAQFNFAQGRGPVGSPVMAGFVAELQRINRLADNSPGFVWRLQTEKGDATDIRAYEDERRLITLSVWESVDALFDFTYRNEHAQVMRDREQWFEHPNEPYIVLWWIPAGSLPSVEEGKSRLEHLRRHGPTPYAFTFKTRFPMPKSLEDLEDLSETRG
jgi:heme-degrading monooxygenase HmoA